MRQPLRSRRALPASLLLVAVQALGALPAAAQTAATAASSAATALFNAGRDLMKEGDYARAYPKLAESARLDPKVGTLARLAECDEKLGHLAEARGHWLQAVNLAQGENDERLPAVLAGLAAVEARVPKISFELSDAAPPAGFTLTVDELHLGAGALSVPLPVEPGPHRVSATADGMAPWTSTVTLGEGQGIVSVDIPPFHARIARDPGAASPPGSTSAGWRTVGIATAAAGLGTLVAGAISGSVAVAKLSASKSGCASSGGGVSCDSTASYDERDASRTAGDVSTVLFVVGGLLAAAGGTVWFLAPRSSESPEVTVGPTLGSRGVGLSLAGGF